MRSGAFRAFAAPPPAGGSLLLDSGMGTPIAAYSMVKLRTAYAGNCFTGRSAGGGTQEIGFSSDVMDTASWHTFCGANAGYMTNWNDQSGNGRDVAQATDANQPRAHESGGNTTVSPGGGLTCGYWDGTNDILSRTDAAGLSGNPAFTLFMDGQVDGSSGDYAMTALGSGPSSTGDFEFYSGSVILAYEQNAGAYRQFGTTNQYARSYWTITHAASANMTAVVCYRNGSAVSESASGSGNMSIGNDLLTIGHPSVPYKGWRRTHILWDFVLDSTQLSTLHTWASTRYV